MRLVVFILPFFFASCSNVEIEKDSDMDSIISEADKIYFQNNETLEKNVYAINLADSVSENKVEKITTNIRVLKTESVNSKKRNKLATFVSKIVGADTIIIRDTIIIEKK